MPEVNKDLAIKLFGRTISLPCTSTKVSANDDSSEPVPPLPHQDHSPPSSSSSPREVNSTTEHEAKNDKEPSREKLTSEQDDEASHQTIEDLKSPTSSGILENAKITSAERETSLVKSSKNGAQSETSVSQDKTPKKPDEILPCPRCNSMDTKFCYYNNYNVSQPRHFCKNCQRYWTAGGTMRNVPVGAGRRKNKNSSSSASDYRQIMVPEALQTSNGLHNAVLTFGSDSPFCDSMASVLSLAEKSQNGVLNGLHGPKQNIFVSYGREEDNNNNNGDDNSVGASVMASTSSEKGSHAVSLDSVDKSYQGFPPQAWPYPWNPAFCQPGYPVSYYPTPTYWGSMPPSWSSVHSLSPKSSVNQSTPSSSPNSPTLGKHSRDGNILSPPSSQKEKPGTENGSALIPKTLRIDDPGEAAKSSIWLTLGIKNDGGGLFKAFASKNHMVEASPVSQMQANPAALSRSLIFHEFLQ